MADWSDAALLVRALAGLVLAGADAWFKRLDKDVADARLEPLGLTQTGLLAILATIGTRAKRTLPVVDVLELIDAVLADGDGP